MLMLSSYFSLLKALTTGASAGTFFVANSLKKLSCLLLFAIRGNDTDEVSRSPMQNDMVRSERSKPPR